MINIEALTVQYGSKTALNNLSLSIKQGEKVAIVGQNGAGKSTLLKHIVGRADSSVSFMPESVTPDPDLTVYEFLELFSQKDPTDILESCGLFEESSHFCKNLSKGKKQRVMLALTLLNESELIILDEPSAGMDPLFQKEMIMLIDSLCTDKTLIITSHNLDEVYSLTGRIVVLKDGEVSFDGLLEESKSYYEYF